MTHENAGDYAAKHPPEKKLDHKIADALKLKSQNGRISCASAHKIAVNLNVPPSEVGVAADLLEIRINRCQMGLFGYTPEKRIVKEAESVPVELEKDVRKSLVNYRLPCAAAWKIAEKLGTSKMTVSSACESLKIKYPPASWGHFNSSPQILPV